MPRIPAPTGPTLSIVRHPARAAVVLLLALALAVPLSQGGLFPRIQWWFEDAQQRWLGPSLSMEHVVVFDVDEESLERLEPELGAWPYGRDVYASVARYLAVNGAASVAYDILFAEARPGDEGFGASLDRRSVLAAAALPYAARRAPGYVARLDDLRLEIGSRDATAPMPARRWPDITLPLATLTTGSGARVGVISAIPDADGILRRIHPVHETYGRALPGMPLAALLAADPSHTLAFREGELRHGPRAWPVAQDGSLRLRFPSNAATLPRVPFYQLAWAARGAAGTAHIGDLVRGKIVFIGSSSAVLGDIALTPVGQVPGVQLSALATELLIEGAIDRPARAAIDIALLAMALALPAVLLLRRGVPGPWLFAGGFAGIAAAAWTAGMALLWAGQQSRWLFALLAGCIAQALALLAWLLELYRERQRLHYEKLAAENANRMKTAFLNRMTHELRIPLTAVMGFNKLNQFSDELGREQRIANSEVIARNCEHLLSLVNENLDLARIEAGQLDVEAASVDPALVFEEVVETLRTLAGPRGVALVLEVAQPLPAAVSIDAMRVRQVLLNLVGNAIKHGGAGRVGVAAGWRDGMLEFSVTDEGPGLPAEARARIFEPFARGARDEGSTGLGLAITRHLVLAMHGRIDVESVPGRGTRFSVRLPAPKAALRVAPTEAHATAPASLLRGRVLVAEDHRDLRDLLAFQLGEIGVQCTAVGDGFAATEAAAAQDFDVVLLDLEMPRMDGYEAAHVLRERGFGGPIIALTAPDQPAETARALADGCSGVLSKPVSIGRLRDALAAHLPSSPAPVAASGPAGAIPVPADPRIADLVTTFLSGARRDIAQAGRAIEQREFEYVRVVGHALKGSGISFGFDEVTRLGGMLEHAARNRDPDSARRLCDRIADYLERVQPGFA